MKQGAACKKINVCYVMSPILQYIIANQSSVSVESPCEGRNSANRQSDAQNGAIGSRLRRREGNIVFPCCSSSPAPQARQQMHYAAYYQHVNIHLSFLCLCKELGSKVVKVA